MAGSLIHIDEHLHSFDSEPASNTSGDTDAIYEGEFVTRASSGPGCHVTDPSSDTRVDGIVPHFDRGDHLPEHDEDYSTPKYEGDGTWDNSDWVSFAPMEELSVVHPWTVKDTNEPAPDISPNDDVVVARIGGDTVVVESGYTDSGSTTYSEANNNAIKIGRADDKAADHEELVAVRLEGEPTR